MSWQHRTGIGRNNLDFTRFALAVGVIFAHSYALLQGSDDGEPLNRFTHGQITFGGLAVDWFFVISGFLITHSWLRNPSVADFFKKRVLRIYPGFIAAVLFCTFVAAPLASPLVRQRFIAGIRPLRLAVNALVLRYVDPLEILPANPIHSLNGSLWSIEYEFWCYVGVVLLGVLGMMRRPRLLLSWFLIVLAISLFFVLRNFNPGGGRVFQLVFGVPRLWSRLLPYYLAGMVFNVYRNQIPFSRFAALACVALLILAAKIPNWGIPLLLPLAGAYLLFWFAFEPRIRLENWARFGDFSYGIYLFAFPIQQLLVMKLGTAISPLFLFACSAPLSIVAGVISWYAIERRFLKLKKVPVFNAATNR